MQQKTARAVWSILIAALCATSSIKAQEQAAPVVDESYLQTCLTSAADMSPIYPTTTFPPHVNSVTAVFRLSPDEEYELLNSRWIAVDVGDVAPKETEISSFRLRLEGRRASDLVYVQDGPMPPGKYRLEVAADGKPWKSIDFTVLSPAEAPAVDLRVARDLIPVNEGTIWNYDFVQEGINVSIPGVEPDAEGRVRTRVTWTVAEVEPIGTRIETRRQDQLILYEWWRVTEGGIFSVRSREPDKNVLIFAPPQMWLPFPIKPPMVWMYEPRNKAYQQTFRLWGPVNLQGISGEARGFVVVSNQSSDSINRVTVERHYIPGQGMVREIIKSAFNDELLRKQEMTLTSITAVGATTSPASAP